MSIIDKITNYAKTNAPSIMAGAACGFVIFSAYKTGVAAVEVKDKIEELKSESEEHVDTIDKVKVAVPYFIEPAIFTALTISLILGSNSMHLKRNATLLSMYAVSSGDVKAYKEKLEERLSKKKAEEVRHEIAEEKIQRILPLDESRVYSTKAGDYLFLDAFTGTTFRSNMETVKSAVNIFNESVMGGYDIQTPMEMLYDNLGIYFPAGIPPVLKNTGYIFNVNGKLDPEYTTVQMPNGEPAVVMTYAPTLLYSDGDLWS